MPAEGDHLRHGFLVSGKQRLDAAVTAVAHPSLEIPRGRFPLDPGAVADAPPPALYPDLSDHIANIWIQPEKLRRPLLYRRGPRDPVHQIRRRQVFQILEGRAFA